MEKRNSYRSRKALGQLYDRVAHEDTGFQPQCNDTFDRRVIEKYTIGEEMLNKVKEIKAQYDFAVRRLLKHHRVATEFELYSGWAMSRPAVGSDYKRQEDLGQEFDALKERFRDVCYEAAGGLTSEVLDPFVAAMYKVTEDEVRDALQGEGGDDADEDMELKSCWRNPLISFPWIFHWILIRIAVGNDYKPAQSVLAAARRQGSLTVHPELLAAKRQAALEKPVVLEDENDALQEDVSHELDGVAVVAGDSAQSENCRHDAEDLEMKEGSLLIFAEDNGKEKFKESAADRLLKLMGSDSDDDE